MAINISDKAITELKKLGFRKEQFLRLSVIPGGCSGMTYSAAIDDQLGENDEKLFEHHEITVVSEAGNAIFLEGLEIDYSDDLVRSGFRFINPNAQGSCGCGSSFSG